MFAFPECFCIDETDVPVCTSIMIPHGAKSVHRSQPCLRCPTMHCRYWGMFFTSDPFKTSKLTTLSYSLVNLHCLLRNNPTLPTKLYDVQPPAPPPIMVMPAFLPAEASVLVFSPTGASILSTPHIPTPGPSLVRARAPLPGPDHLSSSPVPSLLFFEDDDNEMPDLLSDLSDNDMLDNDLSDGDNPFLVSPSAMSTASTACIIPVKRARPAPGMFFSFRIFVTL